MTLQLSTVEWFLATILSFLNLCLPVNSTFVRATGMPSKGGYLSTFSTVYKMTMASRIWPVVINNPRNIVIDAHHFADDENFLLLFCMQKKNKIAILFLRKTVLLFGIFMFQNWLNHHWTGMVVGSMSNTVTIIMWETVFLMHIA